MATVATDGISSSFLASPETLGVPVVGGGGTARRAAARLGSGGAPGPVAGAGDAGREANGDDTDVFPRMCDMVGSCPGDGDAARVTRGAGDPTRERPTAGLAGRELGGGGEGEEACERGRGTAVAMREAWFGVVGVMGRGTVCGEGGGSSS